MFQEYAQEAYYVYIAQCANGALYTGYTKDVGRRMSEHNSGRGGRYTRSCRPLTLLASWIFHSRAEALLAEREIKRLPHAKKLRLAELAESFREAEHG
jgi:putative endonuclease